MPSFLNVGMVLLPFLTQGSEAPANGDECQTPDKVLIDVNVEAKKLGNPPTTVHVDVIRSEVVATIYAHLLRSKMIPASLPAPTRIITYASSNQFRVYAIFYKENCAMGGRPMTIRWWEQVVFHHRKQADKEAGHGI